MQLTFLFSIIESSTTNFNKLMNVMELKTKAVSTTLIHGDQNTADENFVSRSKHKMDFSWIADQVMVEGNDPNATNGVILLAHVLSVGTDSVHPIEFKSLIINDSTGIVR